MKHITWTKLVRWIPFFRNWYKRRLCAQLKAHWQYQAETDAAWEWYWAEKEAQEKAFRNEICARCGHSRQEHRYDVLDCTYCDYPAKCQEFVEKSAYTEAMKAEWKALCKEAELLDMQDDDYDYWQDQQDQEDELSEMRHRDFMERSCQWGEPITLHYHHPSFGYTSLTMLEGEWLLSFRDMREQRMMPDEAIDELERMFEKERKSLYQ